MLIDKRQELVHLELHAQESGSKKPQYVGAYELCQFLSQFKSLYSLIWAMCSNADNGYGYRGFTLEEVEKLLREKKYKTVRKLTIERIRQDSGILRPQSSRFRQPRRRYYLNQYDRGGKLSIVSITHNNPLEFVYHAYPLAVMIALAMLDARDAHFVIEKMTRHSIRIRHCLRGKAVKKFGIDVATLIAADVIKGFFEDL